VFFTKKISIVFKTQVGGGSHDLRCFFLSSNEQAFEQYVFNRHLLQDVTLLVSSHLHIQHFETCLTSLSTNDKYSIEFCALKKESAI
jgi:hypothetical protein